MFLNTEAIDKNCPPVKCFPNGPEILFPFSIEGLQPQNCSYPGFKLVCKENKTTIHFPSYGDLVVKSISYDSKRLSLLDPKNCVQEVFLNLDLSRTPFRYYYILKNYTYLNCSAPLSRPFVQVPCMSGSEHHVYVVASFQVVPDSCKPVKTIATPFSYSPYLADDSFGLGITWDVTRREDSVTCFSAASGKVLSILVFIFMVGALVSVKTYCPRSALFDKLCGYYATLKHAKFSAMEVRNQVKISAGYGNHGSEFRSMLFENENFTWKNCFDGKASVSNPRPELSFQFQKSEDGTEAPQLF
ncbi:hypothetical protein RHSIM_RhsimUnG0040600 [Rhododendron simsii]|uniref:RING-type E3 ubiquitin transferase n=1 Tax=Rhododendron simsii TaxID=118357 RepID=A0A834FVW0_RHOSS|nr:hypothetical protein RHSIM_RhsimUnG0040600 [Rhododendron simsii]